MSDMVPGAGSLCGPAPSGAAARMVLVTGRMITYDPVDSLL
jgi:hypothetical protein